MSLPNVKVTWHGDKVNRKIEATLLTVIAQQAEVVLYESSRMVPFLDGFLMASGDTDIESKSGVVTGTVFYDTPYAVRLHEHPEYNFGNGRQGLYLSEALDILEASIQDKIRSAIKMALSLLRL